MKIVQVYSGPWCRLRPGDVSGVFGTMVPITSGLNLNCSLDCVLDLFQTMVEMMPLICFGLCGGNVFIHGMSQDCADNVVGYILNYG